MLSLKSRYSKYSGLFSQVSHIAFYPVLPIVDIFPAMWSGRFVHLTQSWNNYKCLDQNATTWMDHLKQNGYHTLSLGKLDFTSGGHTVR